MRENCTIFKLIHLPTYIYVIIYIYITRAKIVERVDSYSSPYSTKDLSDTKKSANTIYK